MKTNEFEGKIVVVFGGANGIGKAITEKFYQAGAEVLIVDLDLKCQKLFTGRIEFYQADITQENEIKNIAEEIIKKHKKIDVIINNIRGQRFKEVNFLDFTFEEWMRSFSFILGGSYLIAKYFIPSMINNNKGIILNMASISGDFIGEESASYHVAKAGLIHFTKYLAERYGKFNIRANCISPGFIVNDEKIDFFNSFENEEFKKLALHTHPLQKIGTGEDVANLALFLCSDNASFITGENITLDGGLTLKDQWMVANQTKRYLEKKNENG
jgi:NAD(P)-dependent dehydrogenase (short-subunit alcohol dehydrogenase family)